LHQRIHPPSLGSDIASVQDSFAMALYEKHDGTDAVICINEGDVDDIAWGQLDNCRGI
jgi:hypothetical protein